MKVITDSYIYCKFFQQCDILVALRLFGRSRDVLEPNVVVLRAFTGLAAESSGKLLLDCMRGDLTLFERQEGGEEMWEVVDPLVARWEGLPAGDFPNRAAGTWGPAAADELLRRDGHRRLTVPCR